MTCYVSPNYIGWAPLPSDDGFSLEIGINFSNHHYYLPYRDVVFVQSGSFLSAHIHDVVVPRSMNVTIIENTTNVSNITFENNRVINPGPNLNFVEKATRTMVQRVNMVDKDIDQSTIVRGGSNVYQIRGKDFYVYRSDVVKKGNEGSVIREGVEKNTIQNRNTNMGIQYEANSQRRQGYPVQPNKEVRKEEKIENKNNSQNSNQHQQYLMRWDNGRGNPLVMGNTVQSRNFNIHLENRHPLYGDTVNSKQFQGATNNRPYSYSHYTYPKKPYYQSNSNAKEQKFQNRDFREHSNNNGNVDSRRYRKQTDWNS